MKGKWIVDPEPAEIVRRIFRLFLEGNGVESIAHILQEEQVMIPLAYWFSQGLKRGGRRSHTDPCRWNMNTVWKILRQQEYCGDVINFKTYSKSFKNKKRLENDPENWKVFHDVHEPIIDRETFELVRSRLGKTKHRKPKPENGEKSIFCDLLYCADCKHKLWFHTNTINRGMGVHIQCSLILDGCLIQAAPQAWHLSWRGVRASIAFVSPLSRPRPRKHGICVPVSMQA